MQGGLLFQIQVAYHREPQVLRESVNAEGMLIVRDNEEAQALEMATIHKPLLTSTLHGYILYLTNTHIHIGYMQLWRGKLL